MTGRDIDRAVLPALAAAGLFLVFYGAWQRSPLALGPALAGCALCRKGLARWTAARVSAAEARRAIDQLAALPQADGEAVVDALLRAAYPGERFDTMTLLRCPDAALSAGDVFAAWKAHRGGGALVIAATCPADERAEKCARDLASPRVALVDQRALARLLRRQGIPTSLRAAAAPHRRPLRAALIAGLRAPLRPREIALIPLTALMAVAGKNPLYLAPLGLLLVRLGNVLFHGMPPKRLFPS